MVSLMAGFGEELVFRGYLIWVFEPILGLWGAAVISVVIFGLGHAYQGTKGIIETAIIGAIFTLVVLIFGSLLPAMVLHALFDVYIGILTWVALGKIQNGGNLIVKDEESA